MSTKVTPSRLDSTKDFSSLVPSAFNQANAAYNAANTGTPDSFARTQANNAYDTANSSASFANGAFVTANSAASFANGAFLRANSSYTSQNITADFANSAFTKANNAIANTSGVLTAGDFVVTANLTVGGGTIATSKLTIGAGSAAANNAPLKLTSGTKMTTPEVGAIEYDGSFFYSTPTTTNGRSIIPNDNYYVLSADSTAVGSTIANFFPGTTSIPLVASGIYEIEFELFFTKTTAGTLVWTLVNSTTVTKMHARAQMTPIAGVTSTFAASELMATVANQTAASVAFAATGSLTTGVNHKAYFKIMLVNGSSTSLRLQVTNSAGTVTPLAGSNWRARRIANTSTFSA